MQRVAVTRQRTDRETGVGDLLSIRRGATVPVDHLVEIVQVSAAGPAARAELDGFDIPQRAHLRQHLVGTERAEHRREYPQLHRPLPASTASCTSTQAPPRR